MWGRTPASRAQKGGRREKEESNSEFKINDIPLAFFSKLLGNPFRRGYGGSGFLAIIIAILFG